MFKVLACLALFLLVFRVQADAQADKAQQASQSNNPSPTAAPVAPQHAGSPKLQSERQKHVDADVRVISTPAKDRWDKAAVWINLALALIGAFGVAAAIYTLRFIKKQTSTLNDQANHMASQTLVLIETLNATKKSAEAADISAKAAMGVAVPLLVIHEFSWSPLGIFTAKGAVTLPHINIVVKNYGQSPALVHAYDVTFTCDDLPEQPVFKKHPYSFGSEHIIDANGVLVLDEGKVTPGRLFSEDEVQDLISHRRSLTIYGYIEYGDVFNSPHKTLRFSKCAVELPSDDRGALFVDVGGKKYTGRDDPNPN